MMGGKGENECKDEFLVLLPRMHEGKKLDGCPLIVAVSLSLVHFVPWCELVCRVGMGQRQYFPS